MAKKVAAETKGKPIAKHAWATPWGFLAIGLGIAGVFTAFPFFNTIILAFTDATRLRPGTFNGLENFQRMAEDPRFWTAMGNSALYMVGVVPSLVLLPLLLALLVRSQIAGMAVFRTVYYLPVITSMVAAAVMWSWMLDARGLVNQILQTLGVITAPIPFLTERWLLLMSAMIVTVWKGLGFYMVIYLAALTNVSNDLYEAAAIDGAGAWRKFWAVTVPGVRSTMVLVAALSAVSAFRVFTQIYVLSDNTAGLGGKAMSMVMLIQREGTGLEGRVGYASAISLVMFVLTIGLMIATLRLQNPKEER